MCIKILNIFHQRKEMFALCTSLAINREWLRTSAPAQFGFMNICTVSPDQRELKVVAPSTLVPNNQFPFTKCFFLTPIAMIKNYKL